MEITKDYLDDLRKQGRHEEADKLHKEYLEQLMLKRIEDKKKAQQEHMSENRNWKKKYGLCIEYACLNIAEKGNVRCLEHKERQAKWMKEHREKETKVKDNE